MLGDTNLVLAIGLRLSILHALLVEDARKPQDGVGIDGRRCRSRGCRIFGTFCSVTSVGRRAGMLHDKRSEAIPGTDVTHFFSLSPKVGQPGQENCTFSMGEIDNGSPGWIRTSDHSINSRVTRPAKAGQRRTLFRGQSPDITCLTPLCPAWSRPRPDNARQRILLSLCYPGILNQEPGT
jgi:hypothetical protein